MLSHPYLINVQCHPLAIGFKFTLLLMFLQVGFIIPFPSTTNTQPALFQLLSACPPPSSLLSKPCPFCNIHLHFIFFMEAFLTKCSSCRSLSLQNSYFMYSQHCNSDPLCVLSCTPQVNQVRLEIREYYYTSCMSHTIFIQHLSHRIDPLANQQAMTETPAS